MSSVVPFRRFFIPISAVFLRKQLQLTSHVHVQKLIFLQHENQLPLINSGIRCLSSKGSFTDIVDDVKKTGLDLKEKVAERAEVVKDQLSNIPGKMKETMEAVKDSEISKKGKDFVENVKGTVIEKAMSSKLENNFLLLMCYLLISFPKEKAAEGAEAVKEKISNIPENVKETLEVAKDSEFSKKGKEFMENVKGTVVEKAEKAAEGAEAVKEQLSDFPGKVKETFESIKDSEYAKKGWEAAESIKSTVQNIGEAVTKKSEKVKEQLADMPENAKEKYKQAMESEYAKKGRKFVEDTKEKMWKDKKHGKKHKHRDDD
ncbi:hypothetical protein HELRODRAFT_161139 [Helobdella robusta]|uniref:Uncharacterized protein n=1 Tax=Helobdella robusta TaxID=6412 RepID=T1ER49_HELRO|nr:hypothetical protein HELRODRAFT_161139 [Helobdella robusta]ESO01934.1 hypothetical protein HELRODRAFT_161139 [Helobdella robusta]